MPRNLSRVCVLVAGLMALLLGCAGPTSSVAPSKTLAAASNTPIAASQVALATQIATSASRTKAPESHSAATASPVATEASSTVDSVPGGSPLTRVWQTTGDPANPMVNPIHLALSPDGNIYVGTATSTGLFQVFDSEGNFVTSWGEKGGNDGQLSFLLGLGVDSKGNVYGADFERALINKYDSTGKFLTSWNTEQPIGPGGMAIDNLDNIYIVNHRPHDHQVQKFSSDGTLLKSFGLTGSGDGEIGAGPEDLAIDKEGDIYVGDKDNNRIQKYNSDGEFLATIGPSESTAQGYLSGPWDVSVDGQGNVYVLSDGFLQKFDSTGTFVTQWPLTGALDNAGDVMADADGNLYVDTDGTAVLEKFTQ